MSNLSRETILRRLPELDLHLDAAGQVVIDLGYRRVACSSQVLAVLAEFSRPKTFASALQNLQRNAQGAENWIDLTATILRLHEAGVLVDGDAEPSRPTATQHGYGAAPVHIKMLNDRVRTDSFLAAVKQTVGPGDVVIDIGTGTGVLAIAAAQAGAKHVYAIEQSGIAQSARALFEVNGFADRITLIEGWSTEVELPERGTVLVSEMIGNDPLGERILKVTADAVNRLLEPGARLIPNRLALYGRPLTIPAARLAENRFTEADSLTWQSWYGIDFGPLVAASSHGSRGFLVDPREASEWQCLHSRVPLFEVDLGAIRGSVVRGSAVTAAKCRGELNGALVYFEAELAPELWLTTNPATVSPDNHWQSPVWILDESLRLEEKDRFCLEYHYQVPTIPDGVRARLV